MSRIDASAVYPIGAMLRELAASTPFVVITSDGKRHTGPAEFKVIEGVATLAFEAAAPAPPVEIPPASAGRDADLQ